MADDQHNDTLQNTASHYEGLDPAAFGEEPDLSAEQVADVLMGDSYGDEDYGYGDEYGDEPAYPTAIEAVAPTADAVATYQQQLRELQEEFPHILSPAAVKKWEPIAARLAAEHGWDAVAAPDVLAMIYQRVGGEEGFASEHEDAVFADSIVNAKQRTGSPFEA